MIKGLGEGTGAIPEPAAMQSPDGCLLWAVKSPSRSQWNHGYGADTGTSRGDPCRPAFRPNLKFKLIPPVAVSPP